jgi:hypothetical protein
MHPFEVNIAGLAEVPVLKANNAGRAHPSTN